MIPYRILYFIIILFIYNTCAMKKEKKQLGVFESSIDVGTVKNKGNVAYDKESEIFSIKGSGNNMWFDEDEFHFLYRKMSGDVILYTQVRFIGEGKNPHRKAGLIIRENLEPGSPYVSAVFHGDGLVCMQFRTKKDSATQEFRAREDSLPVLQLFTHDYTVTVQASNDHTPLQEIGKIRMNFLKSKEYYLGLFVCSHDPDVIEEAHFVNTRLTVPAKDDFIPYKDYIGARLEILDIGSGLRNIMFESELPVEAPNWSRDGNLFIVNAGGKLFSIPAKGGSAKQINTDFAQHNNNDHGISPDGTRLVISNHAQDRPAGDNSVIYVLPFEGGIPKQITQNSPSYWHGWSPDGKYLLYTAKRDNRWNIFKISIDGGSEIKLTDEGALNDGSEYSSDGRYIWFNSNRTGSMEIWRMKADGTEQTQITHDDYQNWFPHESPRSDKLVFLSYLPAVGSTDHPYYKHVMIRMLELKEGKPVGEPVVIAHLYGGQGTMNVHSFSPDGKKLAFVSNTQIISE